MARVRWARDDPSILIDVPLVVRNAVRMNVRTNLLLPKELVDEVDHVAG